MTPHPQLQRMPRSKPRLKPTTKWAFLLLTALFSSITWSVLCA